MLSISANMAFVFQSTITKNEYFPLGGSSPRNNQQQMTKKQVLLLKKFRSNPINLGNIQGTCALCLPQACDFIQKYTAKQMFSCEFHENFENTALIEHLQVTTSGRSKPLQIATENTLLLIIRIRSNINVGEAFSLQSVKTLADSITIYLTNKH